jgi:transcriptional regulator with AAA-type ATPase domain
MTLLSHVTARAFDESAWAEIRALLQANQARTALERMGHYEARDRAQQIQLHGLRAMANDHVGDFEEALRHWLRALHLTSRAKEMRAPVRISLADTFTRLGDLARAERVVQRCVAELRSAPTPHAIEPHALGTLARVHFRRGTLSLSIRLFENALARAGDGAGSLDAWIALHINCAHALMRLGEFERADRLISAAEDRRRELGPHHLAPIRLSRALWALETGKLDACEEALSRLRDDTVGDHLRFRSIWLQYRGALELARRRPREALEVLDEAIDLVCTQNPMDDMLAELSRLKATALLELGRSKEAVDAAREALRAIRGSDMLDRPAGLRVAARCLAALGRRGEAKANLAAALSLLESTEFAVERARLDREMEALGMTKAGPPAVDEPSAPLARGRQAVQRFELRDGRCFLTSDRDLIGRIHAAAGNRLPVLIEGETGTGKELVAHLLHELSSAREGPVVVVDCTTLTEALAEGELFGAARGAYTGATSDRLGLVAAADGGTLLFDELPELSPSVQSKLLRLLQEGTYRRLGEARPRRVRVRVIATTNRDSEHLLSVGALKPDLFFRLQGYRIRIRPLRERPLDIGALADRFAAADGVSGVTEAAAAKLRSYAWPGNARQLEMLIHVAATLLAPGRWLDEPLVSTLLDEAPGAKLASAESQRLKAALDASAGNVAAAARSLRMSRQGLYKALRRNGLI